MGADPATKSRIGMACPHCHTEGTVRVSRLNQEIACKKCGTKFRITDTGRVMTAAEAEAARRAAASVHAEGFTAWGRAPRWMKVSGLGAAATLLLLVIVFGWHSPEKIPTDIVGRTRAVSESVARDFQGNVKAVTSSGTQREIVEWIQRVRPRVWGNYVTSEVPIRIDVKILFTTPDRCATLATVLPGESDANPVQDAHLVVRGEGMRAGSASEKPEKTSPTPPKPTAKFREISLLMYWVKVDGDWLLDGKATLTNARVGTTDQY